MPIQIKVDKTEFQCNLNAKPRDRQCQRCSYRKPNGKRCKLRSCFDLRHCWVHLKKVFHVRIAPSLIKVDGQSIGLGLFAETNLQLNPKHLKELRSQKSLDQNFLVFRKGDRIGEYVGEKVTDRELSRRYDFRNDAGKLQEQVAPYAITDNKGNIRDAMCRRNFTAYVNDPYRSEYKSNVKINNHNFTMVAKRNIYRGEELLFDYSDEYWNSEPVAKITQRRKR